MSEINDTLNADALWDRFSGSGRNIVEVSSGKSELRLYQALRDHQRWSGRADTIHGKRILNAQCFTDVIVGISETVWNEDLNRTSGEIIKGILHNLCFNHKDYFKQDLSSGQQPRYLVQLEPNLPKDRIKFLFGNGICLPNIDNEKRKQFDLILTLGDTPIPTPKWNLWYLLQDNLLQLKEAIGFYTNQNCLLFTPQNQNLLSIPDWQAPKSAYLLIRRDKDNWSASSDNGGRAKSWLRDSMWHFERKPTNASDGKILSIRLVTPTNNTGTVIFENIRYVLQLESLGLPQLSLVSGLSKWSIWLNATGTLATVEQMQDEVDKLIIISLDDTGLQLHIPNEAPQLLGKKITEPLSISVTGAKLLPANIPGRIGVLQFSTPISFNVDKNLRTLGRTDPENPAFSPDIALDKYLSQPDTLLWKTHTSHSISTMTSLGLSREHAKLQVKDGQLILEPIKDSCLLQPLQTDDSIEIIENHSTMINNILHLNPDDSVLIGNCILRFKSEKFLGHYLHSAIP